MVSFRLILQPNKSKNTLAAFLYNFSIYAYQSIIWLISPFNNKAKMWIEGRSLMSKQQTLNIEHQKLNIKNRTSKTAWFHCASLGEFEQGRPVIEKFKQTFPAYIIVLTFFSPSGYEVRKNYTGADFICYLPSDTPSNARDFIEKINPSIAFFVKYEFWYNYLRILHEKQIPVISFSAIFRHNQIFFKWYGEFHRNILTSFDHIFVQNLSSFTLLQNIGIYNVTVGGDTRFDRVAQIVKKSRRHVVAPGGAGALHARDIPALVHLRSRPTARRGRVPTADRAVRPGATAARRRRADLPRHRRHASSRPTATPSRAPATATAA